MPALVALRLGFSALWIVAFAYAITETFDFPSISGMYPRVAAALGLILAAVTFAVDLWKWRRGRDVLGSEVSISASAALAAEDEHGVRRAFLRAARYALWLVALMASFWLVGVVAGAGLFVLAFLLVESKAHWILLVAGPLATMGLLMLLANSMNLFWPESLITLVP
ncbi:hypothetical protein [Jiangella asiatica]|uniref:Tripartite tricarboxylate transporter TctB family protein n=1 Tax=Jiangella asiatica TaxID=2530372 RepID=A0A4R5D6J0_9ACTN|nr:hypothetical protein [Jiangella asiatica]TDE07460.1 hypothetical protein E1269_19695 [Jiangella asiatica]